MCGIAGKLDPRGVEAGLVGQMCDAITHRGPDSEGVYASGPVGLGIRRLAVIDLKTGDQPVWNEERTVVVVLNGEIYNYRELRRDLLQRGHRLTTQGDTETIVHLYEEHGPDCVRFLRGMFAFALWDVAAGRLMLARDRLGKKPLFYAQAGDALWFASEPKSILQDPLAPREVNLQAIDAYLRYQYVPDPLSAFAGFSKLPPAHRMLVAPGGERRVERYWKLSYRNRGSITAADAEELVRQKLLESTRIRLRSDVPLGAFLSGGVDSTAVVAAMARQSSGQVRTFTIGFSDGAFDERPYARQVAELFSTDHTELQIEPDILGLLPRLVWHYGEPFADQSAVPSMYLSEITRRSVTVALNGDGGDENFAGYSRYLGQAVVERIAALPAPLARLLAAAGQRINPGDDLGSWRSRLRRVSTAMTQDPLRRYSDWIANLSDAERAALYTPELLAATAGYDLRTTLAGPYAQSDAAGTVDRLLDIDVQTYLPGQLLVKMDIASMAHSLEVRSPMLDHEFMEMAAGLPETLKLHGRDSKHVLKNALAAWVPREIYDRPKQGFTMPIGRWLRGPLRDLPGDVLLDPHARCRGLFRGEAVERLIAEHQSGTADHQLKLWSLIQLELWQRTYIDRVPDGPVDLGVGAAGGRVPV